MIMIMKSMSKEISDTRKIILKHLDYLANTPRMVTFKLISNSNNNNNNNETMNKRT